MPARLIPALLAALLLPLPAFAAASAPPLATIKVALVSGAAGFGDRSFNDEAAAALRACGATTGAAVQLVASHSTGDYLANLVLLATQNLDEVIAIGPGMVRPVDETAIRFGAVHFSLIDGMANQPNVASFVFRTDQGTFLAGALAGMVSTSKHVAFLGAKPTTAAQALTAAFTAGVHYTAPAATVTVAYAGSFDDPPAAQALTAKLFAGGADVIMVAAGPSSLGAVAVARTRHSGYLIGADVDQDALAPGRILTSVVKHVGMATTIACDDAAERKPVSGSVVMDLANGGVSLTSFRYTAAAVTPTMRARLEQIRHGIAAGTVRVP